MENTFPILLERDDIKEDVAKWIQFTMNKINKYKNELEKRDTSNQDDEDMVKSISDELRKSELRLTKLDNFYLSIGNEKYRKVCYTQKKGCIYAQEPCVFKLDRKIRNSLLARNYHDIDIENCHPRIIEQLAEKLSLPHRSISEDNSVGGCEGDGAGGLEGNAGRLKNDVGALKDGQA